MARSDDPRQRGRPGSGDLQEQPPRDDGRPLPRREFPNHMDGVPFITQDRSSPASLHLRVHGGQRRARTCTTRITTRPTRSAAACSGAFIVDPTDPAGSWTARTSGSATTRSAGSRSTAGLPGDRADRRHAGREDALRFMNEGVMMHPWHLHGMPMRLVARDGYARRRGARATRSASTPASAGMS